MTPRFLCALLLLVAATGLGTQGQELKVEQYPESLELLVLAQKGDHRATFELGKGGCLIGPLTFYDLDGHELFRLAPGIEFPAGCGAPSKKNGE